MVVVGMGTGGAAIGITTVGADADSAVAGIMMAGADANSMVGANFTAAVSSAAVATSMGGMVSTEAAAFMEEAGSTVEATAVGIAKLV